MPKDRTLSFYTSPQERRQEFLHRESPHIRLEMVWKVVKKFQETGKTCNRPVQGRKRTSLTKSEMTNWRREWNLNPQEEQRAACEAFESTLKDVVKNKSGNVK